MIPFDWQHAHWWLGMAAFCGALWGLNALLAQWDYRRKATLVRARIGAERCAHCGGSLVEWDGKFHPGDIHFDPDGYCPKLVIHCAACQSPNDVYVFDDDDFQLCNFTKGIGS